jgi:hypothetical protein
MADIYSIALVRAGRHEPATIEVIEEASGRIRLIFRGADLNLEAESDDCFSALQDVRRVLKKDELAAYCYGSQSECLSLRIEPEYGRWKKSL